MRERDARCRAAAFVIGGLAVVSAASARGVDSCMKALEYGRAFRTKLAAVTSMFANLGVFDATDVRNIERKTRGYDGTSDAILSYCVMFVAHRSEVEGNMPLSLDTIESGRAKAVERDANQFAPALSNRRASSRGGDEEQQGEDLPEDKKAEQEKASGSVTPAPAPVAPAGDASKNTPPLPDSPFKR